MLQYQAPIRDPEFLLFDLFRVQDTWAGIPSLQAFTPDLVRAVLEEAGRLAGNVVAPLNQSGDKEGARLEQGGVVTPQGFAAAFAALAEGGWLGLSGNPLYGGQGMPKALAGLIEEMFWAANTSLFLYGTLTVGAAICIEAHGTPEQQALYLPKLYAGEWTGVMALTESHAEVISGSCAPARSPRPTALTGSLAPRSLSPAVTTIWRPISCTWSSLDFPMRRRGRAVSRSSSCPSSCRTQPESLVLATRSHRGLLSTRWASTAARPA
jgi:hypothetical protein